jgi:beta-glucosidase
VIVSSGATFCGFAAFVSLQFLKIAEIRFNLKSNLQVPLAFDEFTFFRAYWDNPQTREFLKELVPNWINGFVPEGKTMDEAAFHDFLIDHPLIKYPYITNGEISMEQVEALVEKCKGLTFTP